MELNLDLFKAELVGQGRRSKVKVKCLARSIRSYYFQVIQSDSMTPASKYSGPPFKYIFSSRPKSDLLDYEALGQPVSNMVTQTNKE